MALVAPRGLGRPLTAASSLQGHLVLSQAPQGGLPSEPPQTLWSLYRTVEDQGSPRGIGQPKFWSGMRF